MVVEKVTNSGDKTVFHIFEKTDYGEPDKSREVTIPHRSEYRSELSTITRERVDNPKSDAYEDEMMELYKVPEVGTIVFNNIYYYERNCNHRPGSHLTYGPYLLVENE